jgi:hypothetical protein
MSRLTLLSFALALSAQGAAAARYTCTTDRYGYRYCRRRHGIVGGAIAGIIIGAVVLFILLMLLCLRRRQKMRFRSPAAGAAAPGRQVGFMYFPTMEERKDGLYHPSNNNGGPQMPVPQTQGAIDYTRAGPASDGGVAVPPPAYAGSGEPYRAPAGAPPTLNPYVAPSGPPPQQTGNLYAPPSGPPPASHV